MAKDGTLRGGPRKNSGRPKANLTDKALRGDETTHPYKILDAKLKENYPDALPDEYLDERGLEIFNQTVKWLEHTQCLGFINPQMINEYAKCRARWEFCEKQNDKGLVVVSKTTKNATPSPYVEIALKYLRQADAIWGNIWEIVRTNSEVDFKAGSPQEDSMAKLFRTHNKAV